ncbi:hypothetical protein D3C76_496910 [compost metagenome]
MHRHLVTVKVGIVSRTYERVKTNSMPFHQDRFKCLDPQSVKGRCAVQQNRMLLNNVFKHIPDFRAYTFNFTFCTLDVMGEALVNEFFHYERLEQFERHFFRQTALVHLQIRADNDNGTTRIVNAFTKQVLAETPLFTFQHVAERFERTVTRTCYRTAAAPVVNQGIYSFLQHTLLVLHDNIRSTQIQQSLQTVVPVNYTAIQIIKVGRCKTAAIELNHWTELRRNNREHIHDHPVRLVAGVAESLNYFQAFDRTVAALALSCTQLFFEELQFFIDIDILKEFFYCLSTHAGLETVTVFLTVAAVFFLGQELFLLQRCFTWICYNIRCKVDNLFKGSWRHVEGQAHATRNPFEIPDMRNRCCQFDVTHAFTANLGTGYFNAAAVAHYAFVTYTFVFTAMTLPVLLRSENALAEQALFFRLQGTIVNGFRFFHFSAGPRANFFRRSKPDLHKFKTVNVQQGATLLNLYPDLLPHRPSLDG